MAIVLLNPAERVREDCERFVKGNPMLGEVRNRFASVPLKRQRHNPNVRDCVCIRLTQ
jgi:hypothetical protein